MSKAPKKKAPDGSDPESRRLARMGAGPSPWNLWGPYLSERQWGTVREDYSAGGDCWNYFPHDHARSRAYRWGEDGLLGWCDRKARLCFAPALWNGKDPIIKERLFGLANSEGNHGEDVKECYFYLDGTPTHSYMKALYRYPQTEFPYARLVSENRQRGLSEPEFELADTGIFDQNRYFDLLVEYAKAGPGDTLMQMTLTNRGPEAAELWLLPTLWFRNTWSWENQDAGRTGKKPELSLLPGPLPGLLAEDEILGRMAFFTEPAPESSGFIFTENETDFNRLYGASNASPYVKDAFHRFLIAGQMDAVNPQHWGTKAAAVYRLSLNPGESRAVRLRLCPEKGSLKNPFGPEFEKTLAARAAEADLFYAASLSPKLSAEEKNVSRQALAGLLWSKQFYDYEVERWLSGDPAEPRPPEPRRSGRNADWTHLFARDVLSMPDKWEYPWFAAWDMAFHCVALAQIEPELAKSQLVLLLREWYMHPNGQIPAYEFAFSDVNPPVHAWAAWQVYRSTMKNGRGDRLFLSRVFQKLVMNFTWWVNRKDVRGQNIFSGGFLGLDNISPFDRSRPLPGGGTIEEADGTAWMAFYCGVMLEMALELANGNPAYEDMACKFFEHFIAIADAMNRLSGRGLWDEKDGFYYSHIRYDGSETPIRLRSIVGLIPLLASQVLHQEDLKRHPEFSKRMNWFLEHRADLTDSISFLSPCPDSERKLMLLAAPSRKRLDRLLRRVFDENEFLSPWGVRSLSKAYAEKPYALDLLGERREVHYLPGESDSRLFGGNSNWRGPVWFPLNFMLVLALRRYHLFYGDSFRVECPAGSGRTITLGQASDELSRRLTALFLPDARGRRPCHGADPHFSQDPAWKNLVLFHEYFHAETGQGLGASHQTGWTALAARLLADLAQERP